MSNQTPHIYEACGGIISTIYKEYEGDMSSLQDHEYGKNVLEYLDCFDFGIKNNLIPPCNRNDTEKKWSGIFW